MRLVGYVRESADPTDARPAFTQQEELRRYAVAHGHNLVAVCQDLRTPGRASRDGYISLLGVVGAGGVDAVLVPGVATLAADTIIQEIMIWDLDRRGVRLVSTEPADANVLDAGRPPAPERLVIRDVLERVDEHARSVAALHIEPPVPPSSEDVLVQILEADQAEDQESREDL